MCQRTATFCTSVVINFIFQFLFSGKKAVQEILTTTWEVERAPEDLQRSQKQRMQLLEEAREEPCRCQPEGAWHDLAKEVLVNNFIGHHAFSKSVIDLLQQGRGKQRNILLTGPANCGKTFLLGPVSEIFKCFQNPAASSFAWLGAEEAEVIMLNDFRWSTKVINKVSFRLRCVMLIIVPNILLAINKHVWIDFLLLLSQTIAWNDFLLLLEGEPVHLPAPKSHYSKDILLTSDIPIFCTSAHQIVYVRGGAVDDRETEMMSVRWRHFTLHHQIPPTLQKHVPPCPHCFATFILQ